MIDLRPMHAAAEEYIRRGWPIVPIPPEKNGRPTKRPLVDEWQKDENLLELGCAHHVLQVNWNIGLLLRDYVDVDLDARAARAAAPLFLPRTDLIYGHAPSSPASHWLYRTTTPLQYKKFTLVNDDERGDILELRTCTPNAHQSVLPPSIHPPEGERYQWDRYYEVAEIDGNALWRIVHLVAITAALAKLHPPMDDAHKAARDEYRLAISGVLARRLPEEDARKIFLNALKIAGDRKDRKSIFKTTLDKLRSDGDAKVKGIPALKQLVGDAVNQVLIWIDTIAEKTPASDKQTQAGDRPTVTAFPVFEDEEETAASKIPICPLDALEGDYIGEMMHALTDGTFLPPVFVRENIKTILGAVINGKVGLRSHPTIHTRHYHMMVSPNAQAGKFESWERTAGARRGFLHDFLKDGQLNAGLALDGGIEILDGGVFGSGEFMAALLSEPQNRRSIGWFDEMSELFEKDKAQGSVLEKKLLELFESETISHGSFKNKMHTTTGVEFSLVGCFTRSSFDSSFAGRGSAGSGLLSRNIFSFADRLPFADDWTEIDTAHVAELRAKIASCLSVVQGRSGNNRYIVEEESEATRVRREATAWIETLDDRLRPRLADHLKRDLILRALFSSRPVIDVEKALRAKIWLQNQYDNRAALWPPDAGSNVERMEQIVCRALDKAAKPLSVRQLASACNAYRLGSGGFTALNAAILALVRMSQIKVVGKTRKGHLVYVRVE